MKTQKLLTILTLFVFVTSLSYAQKVKVHSGKYSNLEGISEYTLVFDYTDVKVGKFKTEEHFLKDKMDKREEKEAGTGEKFKASWFADREDKYEPKFIESFNKRFDDGELKVDKNLDGAEYTMKVLTTYLYPGYNVGIVRKDAEVSTTIYVYKNDAPDTVLLEMTLLRAPGYGAMGNDYNSGYRISEAYAKLSKTLAGIFKKKVL